MEQQTQGRERQQRPEEQTRTEQAARKPERARLEGPGQLAKAVLEGVSLLEMPPARLEELAGLLGNQGMVSLMEQQAMPLEEAPFHLPAPAETQPFPVPELGPVPTAEPSGLTAEGTGGRAFDPAGLSY